MARLDRRGNLHDLRGRFTAQHRVQAGIRDRGAFQSPFDSDTSEREMVSPPADQPRLRESMSIDGPLRLDRWSVFDADERSEIMKRNQDRLVRWFPAMADTTPQAYIDWISSPRESWDSGVHHYAIRRDGVIVGSISAWRNTEGSAELGYWMDGAASGQGVLDKAIQRLIPELKAAGFTRCEIHAESANAGSGRVAIRNGFTLSGTYRNRPGHGDEPFDRFILDFV